MKEILGPLVLPKSSGKPASPVAGQVHFDTATGNIYFFDGTRWLPTDHNEVKHDASSNPTAGTSHLEWTHTPVASMVRGALVLVAQNVKASAVQQTSEVTYAGLPMTKVKEIVTASRGVISAWFLGDGIPQGAQTVKVTVTGAAKKQAMCHTQTGPGPLRVVAQTAAAKSKALAAGVTSLRESGADYGVVTSTVAPTLTTAAAEQLLEENLNTAESLEIVEFDRYSDSINGSSSSNEFTWSTATEAEYGAMGVVVGLVRDFGLVTTLPVRAGRGDRCTFVVDLEKGVAWELVHTGEAVSFPWMKIGGPPLRVFVNGEGTRSNAAYGDRTAGTTTVPELTLPLAGDYHVQHGCLLQLAESTTSNARASLEIAGAAAVDEDSILAVAIDTFEGGTGVSPRFLKTGFAASAVLKQKYKTFSSTLKWTFAQAWILADPVRVG